jgi:hypothetical protein
MGAFGEEAPEPLRRLRDGIRPCDAYDIEPVRARGLDQRRLQGGRLTVQKSRSA